MKRNSSAWLIIAIALLVVGAVVFLAAFACSGFSFNKLSSTKYETHTHDLTEPFDSISVKSSTADVVFEPCADGEARVVCYEEEKRMHTVEVREGTLVIEEVDNRKWTERIGVISFGSPKLTVCIPAGSYSSLSVSCSTGDVTVPADFAFGNAYLSADTGDINLFACDADNLEIKRSTGDILIEGCTLGEAKLNTSTGDVALRSAVVEGALNIGTDTGTIELTEVSCGSLETKSSTGSVTLARSVAFGALRIVASTGSVRFDGCDAAELYVETSTGSITGTLRTEKVFIAESSTGSVDVPDTTSGGRCELHTDTGSIRIGIG